MSASPAKAGAQGCPRRRHRLALAATPTSLDLPIALIEYLVRAAKHDRIVHLDRRMFVDAAADGPANPVQSQLDRLAAAFRR